MIELTDRAAGRIRELQRESGGEDLRLRLLVESGGCSGLEYGMSFDQKKDGDTEMESGGVRFLVDEKSLAYLDESRVDFDDGLTGKGFEIHNPNAEVTCGCGKSFH